VALIVGKYDFVQTTTKRGTLVRVFTPERQSENGLFALDCAKRCLEILEEWYGSP